MRRFHPDAIFTATIESLGRGESAPLLSLRQAMRYGLRITGITLNGVLEILQRQPVRHVVRPAGLSRLAEITEFLVRDVRTDMVAEEDTRVEFIAVRPPSRHALTMSIPTTLSSGRAASAVISVGTGTSAGLVAGTCFAGGKTSPLQILQVVAPGLPTIVLHPISEHARELTLEQHLFSAERTLHATEAAPNGSLSRTIGALGMENWRRLISLRVAIIGCGRTGSLVAASLARLGVRDLTLIDEDRLEAHNINEMDVVAPEDEGLSKVQAVAAKLNELRAGSGSFFSAMAHPLNSPMIKPIPESVRSLAALVGCKQADVLICCVDNPAARLAAAIIAKLYLKPLLDIGSGIFYQPVADPSAQLSGTRQMGGDIRFFLPETCLVCAGGIGEVQGSEAGLSSEIVRLLHPEPLDWREQRAGSLRSLNQVAAGLAIRLLEDFISRRLGESVWLRFEFGENGLPVLEHRDIQAQRDCSLCRLAGTGDAGLGLIPSSISSL